MKNKDTARRGSIDRKRTLAEDLDAWEDNRLHGGQILALIERIEKTPAEELLRLDAARLRNAIAIVDSANQEVDPGCAG